MAKRLPHGLGRRRIGVGAIKLVEPLNLLAPRMGPPQSPCGRSAPQASVPPCPARIAHQDDPIAGMICPCQKPVGAADLPVDPDPGCHLMGVAHSAPLDAGLVIKLQILPAHLIIKQPENSRYCPRPAPGSTSCRPAAPQASFRGMSRVSLGAVRRPGKRERLRLSRRMKPLFRRDMSFILQQRPDPPGGERHIDTAMPRSQSAS